ncbi:MAG TPA: toxin [Candidatus Limnocylindria bacterium]|nr:toxin [Candidatus Limnocylindria bacterium]
MVQYDWNDAKSRQLKQRHGVSFQDIKAAIGSGHLLDDIEHHNPHTYPHQRILVVAVNNYVYVVPYVRNGTITFLKTIYPSRKLNKRYQRSKSP